MWNATAAVTATHLLWVGYRWVEAVRIEMRGEPGWELNGEPGWQFKNGRDAGDWLLWR